MPRNRQCRRYVPDPNDPAWKAGVPGDVGADWDFDDVRDHYLELLYEVDPDVLRAATLTVIWSCRGVFRATSWPRCSASGGGPTSGCGGAFVLWLRDLVPGAGWGLIDSAGSAEAGLASSP